MFFTALAPRPGPIHSVSHDIRLCVVCPFWRRPDTSEDLKFLGKEHIAKISKLKRFLFFNAFMGLKGKKSFLGKKASSS